MKLSGFFILGLLFIVSSCSNPVKNTTPAIMATGDSAKLIMKDSNKESKTAEDGYPERKAADSIYKKKMLAVALSYAEKNKEKESFTYNSEQLSIDSGDVSMQYGHLFDSRFKHLIIRIPPHKTSDFNMDLPVYIYLPAFGAFVPVCSYLSYAYFNIIFV